MMLCLFETNPNKKVSGTSPLTLDIIIAKGLENWTNDHFIQRLHSLPRFENAVRNFFGWNLSKIKNLHMSPQHRVDADDGHKAMIGYYINEEYDTYVELILDSQSVQRHFDKFESGDTKNKVFLDLKAHGERVAKFPEGNDTIYYTFFMNQNALYKGNSLVKAGVSKYLPHYSVGGQRKMFTTLIHAIKRFAK